MADATTLSAPPTGNPLAQAWLVLVLAAVFGAGLAGAHIWLGPIIEANRVRETNLQVPILIGAEPAAVQAERHAGHPVLRAVDAAGATLGWVIPAGGAGFADRIEVLIGVDPRCEKIRGLYVLDQKETPGLGDFITAADWLALWTGLATDRRVQVVKGLAADGQIQAITGATISSESVADIVNAALAELREPLATAADAPLAPPLEAQP